MKITKLEPLRSEGGSLLGQSRDFKLSKALTYDNKVPKSYGLEGAFERNLKRIEEAQEKQRKEQERLMAQQQAQMPGDPSLFQQLVQAPRRVGVGFGEVAFGAMGGADLEAQNYRFAQEQLAKDLKRAQEKAKDTSLSDAERKRWRQQVKSVSQELDKLFTGRTGVLDERIEATDPRKGAAAIIETALYGTGGVAARAAGLGARSTFTAARGVQATRPKLSQLTAGQLGRASGVLGAEGAAFGTAAGMQADDPTIQSVGLSALAGGGFGAGLPVAGARIGSVVASRSAAKRASDITSAAQAANIIQDYSQEIAQELMQRSGQLAPGKISRIGSDTALTAALSLENRTRREGMGVLGRFINNSLRRVAEKNKLPEILNKSFLKNAGVDRKFLKQNDKTLFRLGETITRKELVSDTAEALALKYNTSPQVIQTLKAGRLHYDEMLELANNARRLRGEKLIRARENYVPHLQEIIKDVEKSSFKATGKQPFFSKTRTGDKTLTSYIDALERYQQALAYDMYMQPLVKEGTVVVNTLKELGEQALQAGNARRAKRFEKSANFFDGWLREAITKQDIPSVKIGGLKFQVSRGTKTETGLQKVNTVRSIGSLVASPRYLFTTLPASISQTFSEAGIVPTIKGVAKFAFSKNARQEFARNSAVGAAKRSQGIGVTAGGQLDFSRGTLMKGRTQKVQEFLSMPNEILENLMTGISYTAGRERGRALGLKGRQLNGFADYVAGISQEIYNTEFRAEALRSIGARSLFPFQTFVMGQWNRLRRFTGTGGGIPLTKVERLYQATTLLTATALYNQISEMRGEGSITTAGSFIPFFGGVLDDQLRERFGADSIAGITPSEGGFDRPITAPQTDIQNIQKAVTNYIEYGDWKGLRKEALRWGMGLSGIGGSSQANRTIEGIELMLFGESRLPSGELRFEAEKTPSNLMNAILRGQYQTTEGRQYIEGLGRSKELNKEIKNTIPDSASLSEQMRAEGGLTNARRLAKEHNKKVDSLLEIVRGTDIPFKQDTIERLEKRKVSEEDFALKRRLEK